MSYDPDNPVVQKVALYTKEGQTFSSVEAQIKADGTLEFATHDICELAQEVYSHDDVEAYTTVAPKDKDQLLLALLEAKFGGDPQASAHVRHFLQAKGIPYDFDVWP